MAKSINARLAAAAKAAGKYGKTVAREGRDVLTAFGTAANPASTRKAKNEMQANRFRQEAWNNFDKQVSEAVKAITKGEKGTRSKIHKTNVRGY